MTRRVMWRRLDAPADPTSVFRVLRASSPEAPAALLESARAGKSGRWSFAAASPSLVLRAKGREVRLSGPRGEPVRPAGGRRIAGDAFAEASKLLAARRVPREEGAPPFAGGAIGFFSYEARHLVEPGLGRRPPQSRRAGARDEMGWPDACLAFFDEGLAHDRERDAWFAFAGGARGESAASFSRRLDRLERVAEEASRPSPEPPAAPEPPALESSLPREAFVKAVLRAKSRIRAGDIFQANLSQRIRFRLDEDPFGVYERLRRVNPSPFFGYFEDGPFRIVSGSPERLIRLDEDLLETRPIAGTRPRGRTREEDEARASALLLSEKERAEHLMLVDLERNDLGRVCEYGTVQVDEFMALEEYSHVRHIVSNVRGRLRAGLGAFDALKAVFPGGTITGAPKIRCMEIIDELEPVARGPYTGSLGYVSDTGDMDWNILIRGLAVKGRVAHLQAGAGIVADSIPEKEYDETLYKAEAVWAAAFGDGARSRLFGPGRRGDRGNAAARVA